MYEADEIIDNCYIFSARIPIYSANNNHDDRRERKSYAVLIINYSNFYFLIQREIVGN